MTIPGSENLETKGPHRQSVQETNVKQKQDGRLHPDKRRTKTTFPSVSVLETSIWSAGIFFFTSCVCVHVFRYVCLCVCACVCVCVCDVICVIKVGSVSCLPVAMYSCVRIPGTVFRKGRNEVFSLAGFLLYKCSSLLSVYMIHVNGA